jgi:hypothetical protein
LRTSASALLAADPAEAGDAWVVFFPPSLLPCTFAFALPGTGTAETRNAKTGDAKQEDAGTGDFKSGLPKVGLGNRGLPKTFPPSSGPHDFRGNFVSALDEPCFAGGCRDTFMAKAAFGTPNSHNNSSFRTQSGVVVE